MAVPDVRSEMSQFYYLKNNVKIKGEMILLKKLENINIDELKELAKTHEPLNYSKLCERLNIKKYTSNSKTAQLKDLEALCSYRVESRPTRYIIEEYYDGALEILDRMRGRFVPYVEAILCSYLAQEETIYLTTRQLAEIAKLANVNFFIALPYQNRRRIGKAMQYNEADFGLFIDRTYDSVIRPIIRNTLASMQRRNIININSAYRYKKAEDEGFRYCSSDSDLGRDLLSIENMVKDEIGCGGQDFLTRYQWAEFYRIADIRAKELLGIETFCRCKQIVSTKAIATKNLHDIALRLNNNVIDRINELPTLQCIEVEEKDKYIDDMIRLDKGRIYV